MSDPVYAEAYKMAKREASDNLAVEARRRAVEGVENPVYQGGSLVGYRTEFSDTLLMFLMRATDAKYREKLAHVGPGGGPIRHEVDLSVLTLAELYDFRRLRAKLDGVVLGEVVPAALAAADNETREEGESYE